MEFNCSTVIYQFAGIPSNVYEINPMTGEVTQVATLGKTLNAIGYNPIDNFIYGIDSDGSIPTLYKVDANFNIEVLPQPVGLPATRFIVGAIDPDGYYYVTTSGVNNMYVIDLNPNRATYGKLVDSINGYAETTGPVNYTTPGSIGGSDWTWDTTTNTLCALVNGVGSLRCLDPRTGVLTNIPTTGATPAGYGAAASYSNGVMLFPTNNTNEIRIVRTDGVTATSELFVDTPVNFTTNDATSCIGAEFLVDYGDAPDTSLGTGMDNYNTLLASDGPRHGIVNNLTLGDFVTGENDAYQNANATGDDLIEGIQDDGASNVVRDYFINNDYEITVKYTNDIGEDANIYAWFDFNMNGIFELNEKAEPVVVSSSTVNPREAILKFMPPNGTNLNDGDTSFIRIRITSDNLINENNSDTLEDTRSIGPANDGEVEDYIVNISSLSINGTVWIDLNCDGIQDNPLVIKEGVIVQLFKCDDLVNQIDEKVTDSNGFYEFLNLDEGCYRVKVISPEGYVFTLSNVGNNDLVDSDVNKNTGFSSEIELDRDNRQETIDAGLCKLLKVEGKAFYDCDGDGLLDSNEEKLCGVTVILLNSDGISIRCISTDCDGCYKFTDLEPGNYTVRFIPPPGMNFTVQNLIDFYGSKPDITTGEFALNLTNMDVLDGYAGFKGGLSVDMKYCIKCSPCRPCSNK